MGLSLVDAFDELSRGQLAADNDLIVMKKIVDVALPACQEKNVKVKKMEAELQGAERKIFQLEQRIRTLNIQLEEERETNADLEIENIKMKKEIAKLKSSLESINNNCYDDVGNLPNDYSVISDLNSTDDLEDEHTLLGDDLSAIKLLSNETMERSGLMFDTTSQLLSTPAIVIGQLSTVKKPQRSSQSQMTSQPSSQSQMTSKPPTSHGHGKTTIIFNTITKKLPYSTETFTKKSKRRSKSVDFHMGMGEKTVIEPQQCELCVAKARSKHTDGSPTLPWCPHSASISPQTSIIATPSRSLFGGQRNLEGYLTTSTPAPAKSILKGSATRKSSLLRQALTRH